MRREEAIQALNEIFDDSEFSRYESWYGTAMDMAIEALKEKPVKHGEWILNGGTPICSVCHEEPCWSSEGYDFTDYCPNCGARMDKEKE